MSSLSSDRVQVERQVPWCYSESVTYGTNMFPLTETPIQVLPMVNPQVIVRVTIRELHVLRCLCRFPRHSPPVTYRSKVSLHLVNPLWSSTTFITDWNLGPLHWRRYPKTPREPGSRTVKCICGQVGWVGIEGVNVNYHFSCLETSV